MTKLKIKNFGPIKSGFNESDDGFFEINKYTFIIGDQGTGKSTIAKIFSTFCWLEKAFKREYYEDLSFSDFIDLCSYQRLPQEYFLETTILSYTGESFEFNVEKKNFSFKRLNDKNYICPKIMYIPSERNVVSVLEDLDQIKNIPKVIKDFKSELRKANLNLEKYSEPHILDYKIFYDSSKDLNFIKAESSDEKIPLTSASSGLQSIVPLFLVTNYLFQFLESPILERINSMNVANQEFILNNIKDSYLMAKLKLYLSSNITKNFTQNDILNLEKDFSKYVDSSFINIVEEPELNLFPLTQVKILEALISRNTLEGSKLFITTHSPYILSAMNNFIYANVIFQTKHKLVNEIPEKYLVNIKDVAAYKTENGKIINIKDSECNLIDSTTIDDCSSQINSVYSKLMDIGE